MAKIPPGILALVTLVFVESTVAGAMPEYAAAESKEHIGETARATGNILGSPAEPGIADVTALIEFTGNGATNKGSGPNGLIFASDGDIYGTTEYGGANDYGTVFKMTPAGALSTIVEFAGNAPVNSSGFPMAPLIERRDGDFYGTTSGGGVGPTGENNLDNGTIFKLSRSGVLTTLVRFSCNGATNKGCTPYSGLVEGPNGDFYGTTFAGGSAKGVPIPGFRGFGTIYKMSPAGQLTTLCDFSGHVAKGQGGAPWAGLTLGKDRNLYGNTWLGGAGHAGTIFKMTPRGAMTTLVNLSGSKPPNKGGGCVAELFQASDGNFYGTCPVGGGGNAGTVFKMTSSGAFTNLVEFNNNDPKGAQPHAALAEGNDGNLYGTTTIGGAYNYGTIFRVTPSGSFKVLWNFNNPNKIHECQHPGTGPLLKDKEGNFYGTTKWGGRSDWGTVFKLTLHNSDMQASTAPPPDSPSRAMSQPAQMEQAQSSSALHDFKTAKQKLIAHDTAYHEYSAAEAYKHIGETARLTGIVDCIGNGRRHTDVQIGGCLPGCVLWVVVPNDAKGPELDSWKLLGLNIAVTGKIESSEGTPQITINSTKQIEAQPSTDPNYLAIAHEKENKSDFDGAIADLDRAIEQTHAPGAYTEQARLKANKGDFAGAIRDYDELITRSADTYALARGAQYNSRAQLKIKGADFDGAIADADVAIRLNPRAPWHYSTRGQADEGKGDFAAAIRDYQLAIKTEPHNSIYKDMLRRAQAGASQKHQQSFNKSEATPDSIAEAFVQAYSAADVDAVAGLYADRVDYTNSGVISNAAIRKQAQEYFVRWPVRRWSLAGPVKTTSMGPSRQKVVFSATYDASDPQTNKHVSGVATETLIVANDASRAMKIVSQKEQTSKRGSSQPDKQTSADLDLDVVKAEYGQQTGLACKLVGQRKDIPLARGYAQRHLENGVEILRGNDNVPAVNSSYGVRWAAALGPDGKVLWAAEVPYQPPRPLYGLATDGDHLWEATVLDNGVFQLARFKAGTLEREASVQAAFQVTESAGMRTGPAFEFQSQTEGDLQVSVHRTFGDSAKVVVFSRELRPILDKVYSVSDRLAGGGHLIRLPDRTGYYLVIQPQVSKGKRGPRIGIIRLDNTGAVKWANAYDTGYSDNDIATRVTNDGALLVNWGDRRSTLMKIGPDGTINWATTIEGILVSFDDSAYETPAAYRFTEPSLLAVGIQQDETDQPWWMIKRYSVLFRLNYETGNIEKQMVFGANTPGTCSLVERDANSFYVGFGNEESLNKPSGHGGRHATPNLVKDHGAALRFDYDFNLLAARKIRDAGPILVFFHLFAADRGVISYPDMAKGTLTVETTNANFESSTGCQWLDKENFTFTKSNFQQHPAHVDSSPLTVTVSDANSKISQADLAPAPLDLKAVPCQAKPK